MSAPLITMAFSGGGAPPTPAEAMRRIREAGAEFVVDLPDHLACLPDAPRWLFVKGRLPDRPGVAVVGARRATRYGLSIARRVGALIGGAGWPVVSGLAKGVDAEAHRGCLEAAGTAVAVLGCGIDRWYPAANRQLGERILAGGGAVVSEYPPGTPPEAWRFPARNRIIAGLSRVVLVIEAAERSGALITARMALDQGKEVMAVPGDVDRDTSRGCNQLIRDGAHPITDLAHLVDELALWMGPPPRPDTDPPQEEVTVEDLIRRWGAEEAFGRLAEWQARGLVEVEDGRVVIPRAEGWST